MDIKLVRELAEIVKELNLSTIEVEEGETKIKIENAKAEREANSAPQLAPINTATQFVAPNPAMEKDPGLDFNDVKTVDSPMVGVFYAAPNPDSEPYVA
ncbi:MAG: acetyl-CoA carboxylase biotin carboxyl carrier protein, partial [Christensenellaceae bacterium]